MGLTPYGGVSRGMAGNRQRRWSMELQDVQAASPLRLTAADTVASAPHARPLEKEETPLPEARNSALPSEEQVRHAGSNVGIPPAIDAEHPRIRVDARTDQVLAQIVDENGVVVRQIPPEEQVRLSQRANQLQGLLFDERI